MDYHTRQIKVGNVPVGGGAPVAVQSMTNTDTRDAEATLAQIRQLAAHGCELARVAVPDEKAAKALKKIVDNSPIPIIADIHFDYQLAIMSLENGVACIRINPGNIGSRKNVAAVVKMASSCHAAIRIGVNSGSLERDILEQFGRPTPEALAESALRHARILEELNFENFKLSLKSSSVQHTIAAYEYVSKRSNCPLHIGVTEAGGLKSGLVKSAAGLGILLHKGIGDTLRISLTADPVEEVKAAWQLLAALGLRKRGPEIISCPTCGRTEIDLFTLLNKVETALEGSSASIKVAVMGCVVNGPGEAREADIGVAGGTDKGIIFRKGRIVRSVKGQDELIKVFMEELDSLLAQDGGSKTQEH